ncbi:response regulator receiver domain protein [Leptospira interrogans serovar Bataviae str. HAI135]|nr:response regulator receiver domain protein [Leptospira interrogans serovar Bataviae str. HAI135]
MFDSYANSFLDDEEMIRDLFQEIFGIIHDLTLIGTAEEALEICKDKSFDLIITDVRLPKMSGIDFISRLRDKEINTPFIVITGNQDIEISIRALRLGAVDFLSNLLEWMQSGILFRNSRIYSFLVKNSSVKITFN